MTYCIHLCSMYLQDKCRDIKCYPGRMLVNDTCVPLFSYTSNLGYILSLGVDVNLSTSIEFPYKFLVFLLHEIQMYINEQIGLKYNPIQIKMMSANKPCVSNEMWTDSSISVLIYIQLFIYSTVDRQIIENDLIQVLKGNIVLGYYCFYDNKSYINYYACPVRCSFKSDISAMSLPTSLHLGNNTERCIVFEDTMYGDVNDYAYRHVSELLQCRQIELEPTEISVSMDRTKLQLSSLNVVLTHSDFYLVKPNTARICVEKFLQLLKREEKTSYVIKTIMIAGTCLSLVALCITFLTYCLYRPLRTLPGKNNMSLVFALFCALGLLEFGIDRTGNYTECIVLGVSIHYFWLCNFYCLNVCSFHMFRTFRKSCILHSTDRKSSRKRLLLYILYSYGVPCLVVSLNVIITAVITDGQSYGYGDGGKTCFITKQMSLICTFIAPVAFVCLTNFFFFLTSAISIASTPKVQNDNYFAQNKIHFTVYVKLFIITGSAWLMQIIDSFLPLSAFSMVVSFMNSFQGIYIFLSYICNRRVLCLYRNSIRQLFSDSTIIDKQSTVSYTGTNRHVIKQTTQKHSDKTEQMFSTQNSTEQSDDIAYGMSMELSDDYDNGLPKQDVNEYPDDVGNKIQKQNTSCTTHDYVESLHTLSSIQGPTKPSESVYNYIDANPNPM